MYNKSIIHKVSNSIADLLKTTEKIFKNTYNKNKTEARVLIYKCLGCKGKYVLVIPEQDNTSIGTKSDIDFNFMDDDTGYMYSLVYDLHSHHLMGAFFSSTDNANEMIPNIIFGVFSWATKNEWLFRKWNQETSEFEEVE